MSVPRSDSSGQFTRISEQLRTGFGLQLDPAGERIAAAVRSRAESLGLNLTDYKNLLDGADATDEFFQLAGEFSPSQTAFDEEHLAQVSQRFFQPLLQSRLANKPEGDNPRLNIWFLGCGCGDEIHSVLLELAELTDLSAWDMRVLATDISRRRLTQARLRTSNQFRSLIDFRVHNILAPEMPADVPEKFNLIFCRPALEQLTPEAKNQVLGKLARALSPDGLLIVSQADSSASDHPLLQPTRPEFSSVLRRRLARQKQTPAETSRFQTTVSFPPLRSKLRRIYLPTAAGTAPVNRKPPAALIDDRAMAAQFLQRAQQLLDDFQFPQALLVARRAAKLDAFNLAAHFLTGEIARRMDRPKEAIEALERACYLDKNLVMAHFLLGHIYQETERASLARHHYDRALEALTDVSADEMVLFADVISAGVLCELCQAGKDALTQIEVGRI